MLELLRLHLVSACAVGAITEGQAAMAWDACDFSDIVSYWRQCCGSSQHS